MAELAEIGNVPKKTVSDYAAHGEDAYAQKPIEVRVKGKTWVNRSPSFNAIESGITFSTDETGLITVSGTATTNVFRTVTAYGIATSNQYVLAVSSFPSGVKQVYLQTVNGAKFTNVCGVTSSSKLSVMGSTPSSFDSASVVININSGATVNASFRIMLVEGTEAPDCFTPPTSITSVKPGNLVTSGKNLIKGPATKGGDNYYYYYPVSFPTNTKICVKNVSSKAVNFGIADEVGGDVEAIDGNLFTNPKRTFAFTLNNQQAQKKYLVVYRSVFDIAITDERFQLEVGSTATAYEPPNITTTPLPEVELRSLPNGTCDELVIGADGTAMKVSQLMQYTATGDEDEVYFNNNEAQFYVPGIEQSSGINSQRIVCDKLPTVRSTSNALGCALGSDGRKIFFMVPGVISDVESARQWLRDNTPTFVFASSSSSSSSAGTVTLPMLPAPTFNIYHDSDVPSDTSTTYTRDINIVLANLEAVQTALLGGE